MRCERDAEEDFRRALRSAISTERLLLVDVGGDWCEACRELDLLLANDPDLRRRRDDAFVWLKVNDSSANKNAKLLGRLPFFIGYPHWFLIDASGQPLLLSSASSNRSEFERFLADWGTNGRRRGTLSRTTRPAVADDCQSATGCGSRDVIAR